MKIIFTPMLLKLNLALFFMLFAGVFDSSGQTTSGFANSSQKDVSIKANSTIPISAAALNEYSITNHQLTPASRPAVVPFSCESGLVYIITNIETANGLVSGLNSFDLGTKTQTVIKDPLVESLTSSQFINAIGYNVVDNYIYGLLQGTNQVTKIDATGAIEFLTVTGDFVASQYSSGDVDKNGILYVYGRGRFIAINLNPSAPDYLEAKTLLSESITFHDMAFNPIDDNLYMITSTSRRTLFRFNTATNTVTSLGDVSGLAGETTNSFGTAFMDSLGNMYVSNNASGNIYKITTPHTGGNTATFYNSLTGVPGDGARCPNQPAPPNAEDDQACVEKNEIITIDLIENDGAGTYAIDVASVKFTDPATNQKSTTVTIPGQGTFTVDNKGIMTFTPVATFTEASITYTIIDSAGILSHWATVTVSVNTTTKPTGSSVQSFCEAETPTIADLKATGSAIIWYASETSTTPLLPTRRLVRGSTYFATQTLGAGCESLERLAVTVETSEAIALVGTETLSCTSDKTGYRIKATFTGTAPFEATGAGAPGTFTDNRNKTFTWLSSPIPVSVMSYDVEITDSCGSNVVLAGDAPFDCLAKTFNCDDGLAFILTNTGTNQNDYVTGLYTLNLATNVQNLVKYPLVTDTDSPHRFINAIGYNILDNYLYGLLQFTNKIARIDYAGDVEYFDITGSFDPGYYSSGDIDESGTLYLYNGSKFVSVSLDPASPIYLEAQDLANYTASVHDLAYNNIDHNLYMVTSTQSPKLLRYDIATSTVADLGVITGLEAETTSSFGTAFMDSMGNLFIANNASGKTYKITSPHTGGTAAVFYNSAMEGLQPGDGARCQNQITFPMANDDTECGTSDTDTLINVLINDGEGSYAIDISAVQLLDPITSAQTTSVTIADQGTFTVDANGVVTFSPVATFTETTVQYIIKDVLTNESQPATITVRLNSFEVTCPTFDDLTIECSDLPSQTIYSIAEFEALGNGDGRIVDSSCGIIQITASNNSDGGACSQIITRTYTVTEYYDTNKNGILDEGETTVLNKTECVQLITVNDTTAPNLVTEYDADITIDCDIVPSVPELVFEDACSNKIDVVFTETSTDTGNAKNYVITRTWTVSDICENEAVFTQTLNINRENTVSGSDIELCNDDDIDLDLFTLLSGTVDTDGTWTAVSNNTTLEGSTFNPYQLNLGVYTFKYTVEDDFCPSETLVNITVNDDCVVLPCGEEDVVISKAITTYADGKNDFFTITGVETCGFTYEVQIFNRWGALIYENNNYQNDWNGTSSKASIGSANYVPTGTYYYVVNLKNSGLKPFAGPIYVATK